jgi:hypothetical protein
MMMTLISGSPAIQTTQAVPTPIEKATLQKDKPTPLTPSKSDSFTPMVAPRKASEETNDAGETPVAQNKPVAVAKPSNTLALAGLGLGVLGTALGGAGLFLDWKEGKKTDVLFEVFINSWKKGESQQIHALMDKLGEFVKKADFSDKAIKEFETAHLSNPESEEGKIKQWVLDTINDFKKQEFKPPSSNDEIVIPNPRPDIQKFENWDGML